VPQCSYWPSTIFSRIYQNPQNTYCSPMTVIYIAVDKTSRQLEILQNSLNILQDWSHETGVKFSAGKSQCIAFHSNPKTFIQLYHKNSPIPMCKTLRILGMIFDNKLKWTPHIKKLKNTCKTPMNIIKSLAHHTRGASIKSLNSVYKALILSQIQYHSQIYITANDNILKINSLTFDSPTPQSV